MRKWNIVIMGILLLASFLFIPNMVSGETGLIDVPADESRTVDLGNLITGSILEYSWDTDDSADNVDFEITDGSSSYHEQTDVYGSSGTFEIPSDGNYQFYWYCDNWFETANVDYTYTITLPDPDADLIGEYSFSENPCHQGNTTICTVSITNDWDDQIRINEVWIHFDFFPETIYHTQKELSDIIATDQTASYDFNIEVNTDVSLGLHIYDVIVYYEGRMSGNWISDTWESGNQLDFNVIEIDRDFDGHPDSTDTFPDNPNEWKDSDSDGVGDNGDAFPNDPAETEDTDDDGVGDNADVFPNDPAETVDSDDDGVGDNGDAFPNDSTETVDSDEDGVGDNADVFPNNSSETVDTDEDGVGDNGDAFPNDVSASIDSDNDGYPDIWNSGKTIEDSTTDLSLDQYPEDPDKWKKSEDSPGWFFAIGILTLLGFAFYNRRKK